MRSWSQSRQHIFFPLCVDFRSSHWNHPTMTEKWVVFMVVVFFRISWICCELNFFPNRPLYVTFPAEELIALQRFARFIQQNVLSSFKRLWWVRQLIQQKHADDYIRHAGHKNECVTLDCKLKERLDCSITPQNLIEEVRSPTISITQEEFLMFFTKSRWCFSVFIVSMTKESVKFSKSNCMVHSMFLGMKSLFFETPKKF